MVVASHILLDAVVNIRAANEWRVLGE